MDELGIEPGPALREVEQAILRHDPSLAASGAPVAPADGSERSILVAPRHDGANLPLCSIAEPLARNPERELIVIRLLGEQEDPGRPTAYLAQLRDELTTRGLAMRVAAYTSSDPGGDIVQLATAQDTDLILVDADQALVDEGAVDETLARVLRDAPCDVAVLAGPTSIHREAANRSSSLWRQRHDWAALELAAWTARARRRCGSSAGDKDVSAASRDASRLWRSLARRRAVVGIVAEPMLVRPAPTGGRCSRDCSLLVVGLSGRWQHEGLGAPRLEVVQAGIPTLLVRRGLRPSMLAPRESMTRFTWTIADA